MPRLTVAAADTNGKKVEFTVTYRHVLIHNFIAYDELLLLYCNCSRLLLILKIVVI